MLLLFCSVSGFAMYFNVSVIVTAFIDKLSIVVVK